MNKLHVLISALVLISLVSCEEKSITIPDFEVPVSDKVVLIEELTGVSCPNCPAGSSELQNIITDFEGLVVGVGIHGDFLTEPVEGHSIYDFRTNVASELESHFAPFLGKPAAVINRVQFPTEDFLGIDNIDLWQQYVLAEFNKSSQITFEYNIDYDPATRTVTLGLDIFPVVDLPGQYALSLMVTEGHIIDAQKNVSEIIDDYEHEHVLRDMMTATLGDPIGSNLEQGKAVSKTYTYTIPESDNLWVPENMDIVGFVTDITGGEEEVLQAFEAHIIE